jgi:glycosyltransferase involved in cell wall biosynthesis
LKGLESQSASMNLVVLETVPSSRRGGQELSLLDITRGLAQRGHRITLLYEREDDLLAQYGTFCSRIIQVHGYSISPEHYFRDVLAFLRDLSRVQGRSSMLVYANQYMDSLFAATTAKLHRCPFVCHLRLPPPDVFCTQFRLGIGQASRLIAVSERTRSDYVERGFNPDAIEVVHNGIDVSRFVVNGRSALRSQLGLEPEDFVVTYAGRFHPAKGVNTLLAAVARLRQEQVKCELLLAGSTEIVPANGNHIACLREQADRLGIAGNVHWLGHQSDIPNLFGASDVVVLPSLWSEPFGRTAIESMACGTPAVGSRTGGIVEILTGEFERFTFTPGNCEELANVLMGLSGWRVRDAGLAQRCRQHVAENFDLQRTLKGVEQVLLRTLKMYRSGSLPPISTGRIR